MTDFPTILDSQVAPDAPLTSELGFGFRDAPIAIAEGADNAPVIAVGWHPYDMVVVGDGADGLIYDFDVDGLVSNIVSPTLDAKYEYALYMSGLSVSSNADIDFDTFLNTLGAYITADTATATGPLANGWTGICAFNFTGVPLVAHGVEWLSALSANAVTIADGRVGGPPQLIADTVSNLRVATSVNFDAGKVFMWRRMVYV